MFQDVGKSSIVCFMKTKILACVFAVLAASLLVFFAVNHFVSGRNDKNVLPQVITPLSSGDSDSFLNEENSLSDGTSQTSFVPLFPTETLMSTLSIDFDGDAFDDQIVVVRKSGSPYLFLIVGLYNSETNSYERSAEISTEISKIRTFSYNGIDMVGNHRMTLVYQGIKNDGDQVLNMYNCRRRRGNVEISSIGSFSSDGTIFIQRAERSDAYELSQSQGRSYTVWVYSSDRNEEHNSALDGITQIQTEYSWNPESQAYVQTNQIRVTGNRLAARELSRIQNGNLETFVHFLNGLWYKTSNDSANPYYIYFDYDSKEIILLSDDTEGVYVWEDSSLRRSGIYISTVNSIISSMKRRFDIMLTDVNEVYIHVRDDVGNMPVKESNQWDGTYKKMSFQNVFGDTKEIPVSAEYENVLVSSKTWIDDERNVFTFEDNGYRLQTQSGEEQGIFAVQTVGDFSVIQFRCKEGETVLQNAYVMSFRTEEITVPAARRNQRPRTETRIHKDEIILSPVRIAPDTVFATEGKTISLRLLTDN